MNDIEKITECFSGDGDEKIKDIKVKRINFDCKDARCYQVHCLYVNGEVYDTEVGIFEKYGCIEAPT